MNCIREGRYCDIEIGEVGGKEETVPEYVEECGSRKLDSLMSEQEYASMDRRGRMNKMQKYAEVLYERYE